MATAMAATGGRAGPGHLLALHHHLLLAGGLLLRLLGLHLLLTRHLLLLHHLLLTRRLLRLQPEPPITPRIAAVMRSYPLCCVGFPRRSARASGRVLRTIHP